MKKLFSLFNVCLFAAAALFNSACNSLPEGATAPKLKIESLALSRQDNNPVFIIAYTLQHASPEPLPIIGISADVFIKEDKVATLREESNKLERFELVVPVNLMGSAGADSLVNNTLIMLQGSCALTVSVTDDTELNSFNPVSSYQGLVKVVKE